MDLDQQDEAYLLQLLDTICSQRPREISVDTLADFAKQIWYGELDLVPLFRRHLAQSNLADEQRRYLLYLVDRLSCFPCMLRSKAAQVRGMLKEWAGLKPIQPSPYAVELVAKFMLDKRAFDWGLDEDVSPQMKDILQYQTRHYAAALGKATGYSEP